ncbi:MFS transporter [Catellatospora vulcania]|uniref:MFS transporter n=1 Tax=Catellatospora vulcania TaxID=1460450 RepID=UPI0012D3D5EA|nr:MFS transporter [Catellatospora vulcania]
MRAVLRRPDFRLLFAGLFFSMTAESMLVLALAIWAKDLTGSDGMAGTAILCVVLPVMFAPLFGVVVDRFRRRPFLIATLVGSAAMLTPLLAVDGREDLWIIFAVAICYGVSYILVSGSLNGLIKEVIPPDLLAEANGALQTVRQGLRLVGPLLGAALYAATKGWGLAALGMAGFLIAATVITVLRVPEEKPERTEQRWVAEVSAGVRHLTGSVPLRRALIGNVISILVFGFSETVFFAFVDQGLHRPPAFIGVLVSAQGVGGLLGGLTSAWLIRRVGELSTNAIGVALFLPLLLTSLTPSLWLALPTALIAGFGLPYLLVGLMTLMQRSTPGALMGRVSAAMDALISAPQTLAIGFGALLVELVDFRVLLVVMSAVMVVSALYLWAGRGLTPPSALAQPAQDELVGDGGPVREREGVV